MAESGTKTRSLCSPRRSSASICRPLHRPFYQLTSAQGSRKVLHSGNPPGLKLRATTGRRWDHRTGERSWRVCWQLSRAIDAVNFRIGKVLSWLILIVVIISAANATVRKVFDMSSNAWLELQWVLFGAIFLLCSPWTLLSNEHIRIDIVNNMLPKRRRDGIDVFGQCSSCCR